MRKCANLPVMNAPRGWHHALLRRSERRPLNLFLICAVWAAVFALLVGHFRAGPLELAARSLQDTVVRHGAKTLTPDNLVFLALDEGSLDLSQLDPEEIEASPVLTMMQAEFPWPRSFYAAMIDKLLAAGAKVVVLDVHFPQPGKGDEDLREAMLRNPGRVVIGSLYANVEAAGGVSSSLYHPPAETIVPPGSPLEEAVGFVNFWPDEDRVVRVAHYRMTDSLLERRPIMGDRPQPSLAALAIDFAGRPVPDREAGFIRFCEPGSFPIVPVWQIFVPEFWKKNLKDGAVFRDKTVVFGPLASRFRDAFRTPVGTLPGPELHMHAMAAGQAESFYRRASPGTVRAMCLLMGLVAFVLSRRATYAMATLGYLALALVVYAVAALALYNYASFLPGMLYPMATLVMAGITCFAYDLSHERREKARVRRSLERYVSRDVVRELLDSDNDFLGQLGGTRKEVAVLFSDLRGFTALSENADPHLLVSNLNEYLARMVEIVFRHRGTLDKFIGDAVMAVWGTIGSGVPSASATGALVTALEMLSTVGRLRKEWLARGAPDLRLGIGLHLGPAIFGNIGSDLKMEPTVIGDTVNLASRLESLTKRYGQSLLFSGAVATAAGGGFVLRTIDTVRVVGRKTPVDLFTVPVDDDGNMIEPAWLPLNEEAWRLYRHRDFAGAARLFGEALSAAPGDKALVQMTERCRELLANPPGPEWEPVLTLDSK